MLLQNALSGIVLLTMFRNLGSSKVVSYIGLFSLIIIFSISLSNKSEVMGAKTVEQPFLRCSVQAPEENESVSTFIKDHCELR